MFHVEHVIRAARFAGHHLDPGQLEQLERYRLWLATEGISSGGLGSAEAERLETRHLADSLIFASQLPSDVSEVWDLGTGVGLPGIPLAILLPDTMLVLIDRSAKRIDLVTRAIRILQLSNCQVVQCEMGDLVGSSPAIVSRASLPAERLSSVVSRHLDPGGTAVVAGSWQGRPRVIGWETIEIPADVLDQTVWLLIMRRQ